MAAPRRTSARSGTTATASASPFAVVPAPVVLLVGTEQALADVAVRRLTQLARAADPDVERHAIDPAGYSPGAVLSAAAMSLFGGRRLVVLSGLESAAGPYTDEVLVLAQQLCEEADPDLVVVGRYAGGSGSRAVLSALEQVAGAVRVECAPLSNDRARNELVTERFRSLDKPAQPDAVALLVEAVGADLAELLALAGQLVSTAGTDTVTVEEVRALVGGRREARGFDIADAAVAGEVGKALSLLRHALARRVEPVLVVGALASKLRAMAKVAGAGRGAAAGLAKDLGMAPWQIDRARRDLRGWEPAGLRAAVVAVADADAAVKGEVPGIAAAYALERAVIAVTDAHGRSRVPN